MKKNIILITLFFAATLVGCNKDSATTSFVVRLTDSPGDYEKVNIDIVSVEAHSNAGNQTDGWVTLSTNAGVYDLLELTNGIESVLVNTEYPTGMVSQIRLILGDNNSVVVGGVTYPLFTTSGDESGLKILINKELTEGIDYSVLLDFDASRSVIETGVGNNNYNLKPVIRAVTEAENGAIKGVVSPISENVAVYAISGLDTLSTSYATAGNGDFFLGGLATGSYTISFDPGDLSSYLPVVIDGIEVVIGDVTTLAEPVVLLQ